MTLAGKIAGQQVAQKKKPTLADMITNQQGEIEKQLAGVLNSGSFVRAALTVIKKDEKLQMCSPTSVLGAIMLAAQLKLEIGAALGQFYLTPRLVSVKRGDQWDKEWQCLPIVGYQGFVELAYRSGRVDKVEALLVREGDNFTHGANSERGRFFDWLPADYEETRDVTGVIAMAKIKGGGAVWVYLPKDKILARRPAHWEKSPWKTNPDEMMLKTGIRALAPYMPKSIELARAVEADENKVESIAGLGELIVTRDDPTVYTVQETPADPMSRTPEEQAEDGVQS